MLTYLNTRKTLVAAVVAVIAGLTSAKLLVQGTPLVTAPWAVLAFLSGFLAASKREALVLGGLFGFVASYSYLWFDHTGSLSVGQIVTLIFLIILPSLFGLLCGLLCAWIGWLVHQKYSKTA